MSTVSPESSNRGTGLATIGTLIPGLLLLGLYVVNVWVVPAAKHQFDDRGMTLPWLTLEVIRVSNWVANYSWYAIPAIVVLGIGHFVLLRWLGRRTARPPILWMSAVSLILAALILGTLVSIELPMMKARDGLAG